MFTFIYTDATPSAKKRFDLGWIMIALFFLMFVVNISYHLTPVINELKVKFYAFYRKPAPMVKAIKLEDLSFF